MQSDVVRRAATCVEKVRTVYGSLICPDSQGACGHSVCAVDGPLVSGCDDPPVTPSCVTAICAVDPACRATQWNASCVAAIETTCGYTCD